MVQLERETSNSLFEALEEWNTILEAENFAELIAKPNPPRGPRP